MEIKKSKEATLPHGFLSPYVFLGLVFVLSVCYIALEWSEKEMTIYESTNEEYLIEDELDVVQTEQQEATPPPPQEQLPQEIEELIVVDDDKEVARIEIDAEDNNEAVEIKAPIEAPIVEEEEEVEQVFTIAEKMPEFPGGPQALFKYLNDNVKYPVIAQENGISGRVICQFTVNKDGSIVDVEVARSSGDASLDKEAVRVIKSMPKWNPGKQGGKAVRVKYTVPVSFKLQ